MIGFIVERLFLRKLWRSWRNGLEAAAVPGSGGVVFLGDSLTHNGRWDLLFPDIATRNFGISGERTEHLLTRLSPIIALNPDKIFILIGTNDLTRDVPLPDIVHNVDFLVDQLKRETQGKIFIQGVLPRAGAYTKRIHMLNGLYRKLAEKHTVTFVDLFPAFDDQTGRLRADLTDDSLHLLGAGYDIWRTAIAGFVRS